ncbi:MAG TPA: beta-propeller domain-containing protein [Candidatus Acidoferrum sp.]|jgi:uncharacterized secreted protein with C-terminal beta-propeller domain|nr:beta-propeller domain-containing protein [Candidatus Acidoferrum sp.]
MNQYLLAGDCAMEKEIKKKTLIYGIVAILLTTVLASMFINLGSQLPETLLTPPVPNTQSELLSTFSSYDALKAFLTSNSGTQGYYPFYGRAGVWLSAQDSGAFMNSEGTPKASGYSSSTFDYSATNVQVAGVDEADIVKTDGEYLYILSGNVIVIVKAYPPENAEVVARLSFDDMSPKEIFVNDDHLIVFGYEDYSLVRGYYPTYATELKTFARLYDISDRKHPISLRDTAVSGGYVSSRMIGEYAYFVVSQPAVIVQNAVVVPKIYSNSKAKEVAPTDIHYSNTSDNSYDFTTLVAVNVQNSTEAPTYLTVLLGGTSNIYVSQNDMYLTFPDDEKTAIYRVRLQGSNMTCEAHGKVSGRELNQFSMDEYNGHFRIVTRLWINGTSQTCLYVLDMNLTVLGSLEGLGLAENLHSSRFMGDRCYLVTFKKTDPLFVINLTDPTKPAVLGELKIPGYSDYLHPYDETHIIGVGKETAEASEGDFAWYQGIKISLFDVSNISNPIQVDKYVIGERGSDSPILSDHKAFLFDKEKNLLVIPVLVAEVDRTQYPYGVPPYAYGTPVWQGAYVFNITLNGFMLKGKITHAQYSTEMPETSYWIKRALYIENVLYTVSDKKVKMNSLEDLTPIKEIEIP